MALGVLLLAACAAPDDPVVHLERAGLARDRGATGAALIEYRKALRLDPANRDARFGLGALYVLLGDGGRAERELRPLLERDPGNHAYRDAYVRALLLEGRYERVVAQLGGPAGAGGRDAPRLALLGDAFLGLRDWTRARASYQTALGRQPGYVPALLGLARVAAEAGDLGAARRSLARAAALQAHSYAVCAVQGRIELKARSYAASESGFGCALQDALRTGSPALATRARLGLIGALLAQHKREAAERCLAQLDRDLPGHPIPRYWHAVLAYEHGDLAGARRQLQYVLARIPDHGPSLLLLGAVDYGQGLYDQAEASLSRIVEAAPSQPAARKLLAATYLRQRRPGLAVQALRPVITAGEQDPGLLALMGSASYRAGRPEIGVRYLSAAAARDPDNTALRVELARARLAAGQARQASDDLRALFAAGRQARTSGLLLALARLRAGDPAEAAAVATRLAQLAPDDPLVLNIQGVIAERRGRDAAARAAYERALTLDPGYEPAAANLARLDFGAGRLPQARARYQTLLARHPGDVGLMMALGSIAERQGERAQVLGWLRRACAADPRAVAPRLALARYHLVGGAARAALEQTQQAYALAPRDIDVLLVHGLAQLESGLREQARATFEAALGLHPDSAPARYYLARIDALRGDFAPAKTALQRLLAQQPGFLPAVSLLVHIELIQGDTAAAAALVAALQRRHPDEPLGRVLAGDVEVARGEFAGAVEDYDRALAAHPNRAVAIRASAARAAAKAPDPYAPLLRWLRSAPRDVRARVYLATAYQRAGDIGAAIEHYRRALEIDPEEPTALNNLAWLYAQRQAPQALSLAQRAHRIRPRDGAITDTLGWLYARRGEYRRAVDLLREAASQAPRAPEIRYHLAVALARSGTQDEARRMLTELLSNGAAFEGQEAAKRFLKDL